MINSEMQFYKISNYLTKKACCAGIPLHGIFELTSRCNFNCKMCYVHQNHDSSRMQEKELTVQQWIKIAQQARDCGLLFLLLTGGEVMVRKDFVCLYEQLAQMGFRIVINTNGSLIQPDVLACFKKYPPARINISMYGGSDKTYENLCGVRAFKSVTENICILKQMDISVRITMTLTPYNYSDMETVYRFAQTLQLPVEMSAYMFPQIRRDDGVAGENDCRMTAEMAGKYMVKRQELILPRETFCRVAAQALEEKTVIQKEANSVLCQAGRSSFWITWDGKMRPCGMMTAPEISVVSQNFGESWHQLRRETAKIRLPDECCNCRNKNICRVCAAMCVAETGYFNQKPEYVCRMAQSMRKYYKERLDYKEN